MSSVMAFEVGELYSGSWSTNGGWSNDTSGPVIESVNPATGELLGRVRTATAADYERMSAKQASRKELRDMLTLLQEDPLSTR